MAYRAIISPGTKNSMTYNRCTKIILPTIKSTDNNEMIMFLLIEKVSKLRYLTLSHYLKMLRIINSRVRI